MEISDSLRAKIRNGREYRAMSLSANLEPERRIVYGYAATFDEPYELYRESGYVVMEVIDPAAFNDCDMSDVIMQYDHEGRVFARTRNNTLSLRIDSKGLYISADLGGTEEGRKLYDDIKGGYIDRMSFGFVVDTDSRTAVKDHTTGAVTITRRILKVKKLYDVSAVSMPANDMTSISARGLADGVIAGLAEERRMAKIKQLKLKLLLEE